MLSSIETRRPDIMICKKTTVLRNFFHTEGQILCPRLGNALRAHSTTAGAVLSPAFAVEWNPARPLQLGYGGVVDGAVAVRESVLHTVCQGRREETSGCSLVHRPPAKPFSVRHLARLFQALDAIPQYFRLPGGRVRFLGWVRSLGIRPTRCRNTAAECL